MSPRQQVTAEEVAAARLRSAIDTKFGRRSSKAVRQIVESGSYDSEPVTPSTEPAARQDESPTRGEAPPGDTVARQLTRPSPSSPIGLERAYPTIITDDLTATRDFFVGSLGFTVDYDSDWFVSLASEVGPEGVVTGIGLWSSESELIPAEFRASPAGMILTFIVSDVDDIHRRARQAGDKIVAPPRNLFYGQRRLLLEDPNGLLIDVSSPVAPSPAFQEELARRRSRAPVGGRTSTGGPELQGAARRRND